MAKTVTGPSPALLAVARGLLGRDSLGKKDVAQMLGLDSPYMLEKMLSRHPEQPPKKAPAPSGPAKARPVVIVDYKAARRALERGADLEVVRRLLGKPPVVRDAATFAHDGALSEWYRLAHQIWRKRNRADLRRRWQTDGVKWPWNERYLVLERETVSFVLEAPLKLP